MNKKFLLLVLPLILAGCSFDFLLNAKEKDQPQENEENHEENTGDETTLNLGQEYTLKIETFGGAFSELFPSQGVHFSNVSYQTQTDKLINFIDNKLSYDDLMTTIEIENMHVGIYDSKTYLQFGGSSDFKGSFKWNSVAKIYNVKIEFCNYAKVDTYHGITNVDVAAIVSLDDLSSGEALYGAINSPITSTLEKTYSNGVNSFTISSSGQRSFLKSISITWRG